MAYTNIVGEPGLAGSLNGQLKRASSHVAAFEAIVAEVEALLANPEDLRPAGGPVVQHHAQARGLPVTLTRFDRPVAERVREQLSRLIEAAYQNTVAASRR